MGLCTSPVLSNIRWQFSFLQKLSFSGKVAVSSSFLLSCVVYVYLFLSFWNCSHWVWARQTLMSQAQSKANVWGTSPWRPPWSTCSASRRDVNCSDNSFFLPWEGLAQVHPMITFQWSHFGCCVVKWWDIPLGDQVFMWKVWGLIFRKLKFVRTLGRDFSGRDKSCY